MICHLQGFTAAWCLVTVRPCEGPAGHKEFLFKALANLRLPAHNISEGPGAELRTVTCKVTELYQKCGILSKATLLVTLKLSLLPMCGHCNKD